MADPSPGVPVISLFPDTRAAARPEPPAAWAPDARPAQITLPEQRSAGPELEGRRELERRLRESEQRLQAALERERAARAEAEAARRAAEAADRVKGEFLAAMSHELRTPLNAITGYSDLLELGVHGALTRPQQEAVGRIRESGWRLLELIDRVLCYARVESGGTRYDLCDVPVDAMLRVAGAQAVPQMTARGIRFDYDGCDRAVAARADPDKVQQIMDSLLSNATRFTEPGGCVRVECEASRRMVRIRVCDTGIGIAPQHLETVFEPFVQVDSRLARRHDGVGLGLAIGRQLARGMRGDLTVESTPGHGSVFTLSLPRAFRDG